MKNIRSFSGDVFWSNRKLSTLDFNCRDDIELGWSESNKNASSSSAVSSDFVNDSSFSCIWEFDSDWVEVESSESIANCSNEIELSASEFDSNWDWIELDFLAEEREFGVIELCSVNSESAFCDGDSIWDEIELE